MKILLPKEFKVVQSTRLFSIEVNNFDVEMLLPSIFYLVRTGALQRKNQPPADNLDDKVSDLVKHESVKGFEEEVSLLGKWVRTSIVATGTRTRAHKGEQMLYIKPLSLLSYKPGFPPDISRIRKVDRFIYNVMKDFLGQQREKDILRSIFQDAFSKGLELPDDSNYSGNYDEITPMDTETLLLFYFLEAFDVNPPKKYGEKEEEGSPVCKLTAKNLAEDIVLFITVYRDKVPIRLLSHYLMTLINFELLIYTLRLIKSTNDMFSYRTLTLEMGGNVPDTPLDLYIDVIQERGSMSDFLATQSVNRDLEEIRRYFGNALRIRMLDNYVQKSDKLKNKAPSRWDSEYLNHLLSLEKSESIQVRAENDWEKIEDFWKESSFELPENIQSELSGFDNTFDKILRLMEEVQEKGIQNYMRWFWSVGGFTKPFGLVRGNIKGKRVARYVLSDMLLETLVHLSAVLIPLKNKNYIWQKELTEKEKPGTYRRSGQLKCLIPIYAQDTNPVSPKSFSLRNFLELLHERYGILIDRPPEDMLSTETLNASSENLQALKNRLRFMGMFEDLSDDFTAQMITPHYLSQRDN